MWSLCFYLHYYETYVLVMKLFYVKFILYKNYEWYHQQNKYYPKGVYLHISKLHSILVAANLFAHNNLTINYYVQVNSLQLKSNVDSKLGKQTPLGYHLF